MAKTATRKPGARRRARRLPALPFPRKLVLNQWMLGLFGVERFKDLAEHLRDENLEGLDENNIHRLHHALAAHFPDLPDLPAALLLEYDQNIVAVTQRLNERRITLGDDLIVWKYFQYLTLLFTEIYLDRYFRDPEGLLKALNAKIAAFNESKEEQDRVSPFDESAEAWPQLNKIAFWSATGSGKTLLMHANILQYQRYLETHGRRRELNRILLLTPNEGLSRQHLGEFEAAGIHAELFDKDGRGLFTGHAVEILDIHKLKDEMGAKTVAVEAFEGNNLVLIDEGHRGASGGLEGVWMGFRNALCEKGFSFEYSATFGQAVKADKKLADLYARSILFDYSYRYFYGDGFGKDYQILNLDEDTQASHLEEYLVACLLAFFQQQRLFREASTAFRPFNLEKPLWIFVGGKVTATLATKDASDIIEILRFLSRYVSNREQSIRRIANVLNEGLVTATGRNLFAGRFVYLNTTGLSPEQVFDESLATLFNASGGGALHVANLKAATGEIALRIGDNDPFGVINVGDDAKLVKLCEEKGLNVQDWEFERSLFHGINNADSKVNLLIGSKKFTEGWNSWRVGTMGLMNVGATEGSQIIQLFGRGVRLKGHAMSLKRTARAPLPEDLPRPKHIATLETLNIFGIHADYMAKFREFLEEEGLPLNDERIELILPIIRNLGARKLKTIRLKKTINGVSTEFGDAFRKLGPVPTLQRPDPQRDRATAYLQKNQVALNWYPKIQALKSDGASGGDADAQPNQGHLGPGHVAFLDLDRLFFDLERFKAERGWYNLNLTRDGIEALLADTTWYRLLIPEKELAFDSFERVRIWQEIALALLKEYTKRYYTFRKREWEMPHLEYRDLLSDDPNFPTASDEGPEYGYRILIEESEQEIVEKLKDLRDCIQKGELKALEFRGLKTIWFGQHLYQPLLHLDGSVVEIRPTPLNKGERVFVEDLKAFHDASTEFFADKELYLLRNLSKGRGVGFFEAGNFHPDFILWLLIENRQHVVFVDPKGILNVGVEDPKISFYETIKEIEQRLGDPAVILDSFIVSNTPSHEMRKRWGLTKPKMLERHIVFQAEDRDSYIATILRSVVA